MRPQRGAAVRPATRDGHRPCCRAVARWLAARQASRVPAMRLGRRGTGVLSSQH